MAEDRFVSPEPPPTAYEAELLTILIEECAEVQQRATKMLRFGVAEVQPGQSLTNAQRLSEEVGDLLVMINYAERSGLLERTSIEAGQRRKHVKLAKYLQTGAYRTADRTASQKGGE